jgi:molybdopterin molybdotransferase
VAPALRLMMGLPNVHLPSAQATLTDPLQKAGGLTEFVRCRLEGSADDYRVRSTGSQSSGVLRSLSLGDALIVGPADVTTLPAGARVRVVLLAADAAAAAPPF